MCDVVYAKTGDLLREIAFLELYFLKRVVELALLSGMVVMVVVAHSWFWNRETLDRLC